MANRRNFIKGSIAVLALSGISGPVSARTPVDQQGLPKPAKNIKLRFAIASDGHYGQPETEYNRVHANMIKWLNDAHQVSPLSFVIINGDLVHDRPDLLKEVKADFYDHLKVPFYAIPGNHDHADTATWKAVFGYEDSFSMEKNGVGFVLANTSNTTGKYLAPDPKFLKMELDKFTALKTVFVVLHIPPHLWVPENSFVDSPDTVALLHSYPNVRAVFHGHDHNLDSVFYTERLPHFFDSHIGGSWGTSYRGYRIVEVSEDDEITTYQVNASSNPVLNTQSILPR